MKFQIAYIFILLLMILIIPASASKTINVPGDFGIIGQAVEAAQKTDTIAVAPGRYREDIEIKTASEVKIAGACVIAAVAVFYIIFW